MGVMTGKQKASWEERLSQFLVSSMVSTYVGFERYDLCKILGIHVINHSGLYECKVLQCRKKAPAPIVLTLIYLDYSHRNLWEKWIKQYKLDLIRQVAVWISVVLTSWRSESSNISSVILHKVPICISLDLTLEKWIKQYKLGVV